MIVKHYKDSRTEGFPQCTEAREDAIQELIQHFCINFAEDRVNGSAWDNEVISTLQKLKESAGEIP